MQSSGLDSEENDEEKATSNAESGGCCFYKAPAGDTKDSTAPVYKEISRLNGKINQMSKIDLERQLRKLNLNSDGAGDVLKRRLKNYYTKQKLAEVKPHITDKLYPYYVVIDFEATCEEVNDVDYVHEIIEFPAVLVNSTTKEIIDEFHSYCKPLLKPQLSTFCTNLTGITQEQVDKAETFSVVFRNFETWLDKHNFTGKGRIRACPVTDGPWDMGRFLFGQCKISEIPFPPFCKRWVNIRKSFSSVYKFKKMCLNEMLQKLGMNFEGRPHSGLDDARNIARILIRIAEDGGRLFPNERLILNNVRGARDHAIAGIQYDLNGKEIRKISKSK